MILNTELNTNKNSIFYKIGSNNNNKNSPTTPTTIMLNEMQSRVEELEYQLAEREKLIEKLSNNTTLPIKSNNQTEGDISATVDAIGNVIINQNIDMSLPRLINLNNDSLFSECLVYYINEGRTLIGI